MRIPGSLLRDRISVEDYSGTGAYGPAYGSPYAAKASVQPTHKLLVTADGRELTTDAEAFVRPDVTPPAESRVTWNGKRYRVLALDPMAGSEKPGHNVLRLGRIE